MSLVGGLLSVYTDERKVSARNVAGRAFVNTLAYGVTVGTAEALAYASTVNIATKLHQI